MGQVGFVPEIACSQDKLFEEVLAAYGTALERLAHAYEAEPDTRRDLLQEMHIALWRSLEGFDNRCSLRTWVYRVAHNTAASHVTRQLRMKKQTLVGLEQLADLPDRVEDEEAAGRRHSLEQLLELIRKLEPLDRQVMLAYRRNGCGLNRGDHGSFGAKCSNQNSSGQTPIGAPVPGGRSG